MKLKQLSIPLENSPGRLHEVTRALGDAGINLRAHCICDSTHDFGVLRILVSDLAAARAVVMERLIPARVDDVVAVEIEDTPGSLADLLSLFLGTGINVDYMYAVAGANLQKAVMVFHFSAIDRALKVLEKSDARLLDAESFGILVGQD
ncbi:amino acid-binding protein [Geothermobacter hydrogeniphilus]|uniref:Amino acid-binding protein n=1 Tax=Geothermobacter hydrogeniphilus TaxID=1969733 RepID=A0A2K2H717_9BACT|nr:amino acid-binding protein [Geothermobacter hydrogeniphilus]PNU19023.1 amino acid-binding protein [Geothermobacter hydrogeniphilus]